MRPTSVLRNAIGAACSGNAAASSSKTTLPPIRYHLFRNPLPYPTGLKLQNAIIDRRLKRKEREPERRSGQDVLLLLEHTPTYTTGRRDNSPNPNELHPEERKVQNVGADFFITKRGGQVTYHGPGQLVGYPIFDLNHMDLSTRCYVEYMQRLLAEHCRSDLGLENILAPHPDGHVGVFASPTEKVASIGIHLRHRITSHGFAINVTDEPTKWFDLVMACGLADVRAVSLVQLLERQASSVGVMPPSEPSVRSTAKALIKRFELAYGRTALPLHEPGDDEVRELQQLCEAAEEEAERLNTQSGGWPIAPRIAAEGVK